MVVEIRTDLVMVVTKFGDDVITRGTALKVSSSAQDGGERERRRRGRSETEAYYQDD